MCAKCDKKCCANCAHCYETKEGGSYGCTQNVFKPGDLLDDEIHGEFQDGDTTCTCWAPDEEQAEKPGTVPGAHMRDVLLDVAAAANDALYTSHATPEDAAKAYAEAIDLIKKSVCPPDTFFTPAGLLPALPAPKRDWLDMPGDFRLNSIRIDGRTKFVGVRHNRGDKGGNIYGIDVDRAPNCSTANFVIERNGGLLAEGTIFFGRWKGVERAAVGMLKGILAQIEKDRRHNRRNKKNRKARKAAARKNGELKMDNGECGGAEL